MIDCVRLFTPAQRQAALATLGPLPATWRPVKGTVIEQTNLGSARTIELAVSEPVTKTRKLRSVR